jgi:hypothetical protein
MNSELNGHLRNRKMPTYYWTKVWGRPSDPEKDALLFRFESVRDSALRFLKPGDIVVYLTSEAAQADPKFKGRVSGAVQIAGETVTAEQKGLVKNARPEDFNSDGDFRWPYGITIDRTWRLTDQMFNDQLVPEHKDVGIQGAATVHEMSDESILKFQLLTAKELTTESEQDPQPFRVSLKRPWKQKTGTRNGSKVNPGTDLYVAVIHSYGLTFKIGSGKSDERLRALNLYRRGSQGEAVWSIIRKFTFDNVEAARLAEDWILKRVSEGGNQSVDHSEFIVGMEMKTLDALWVQAIDFADGKIVA